MTGAGTRARTTTIRPLGRPGDLGWVIMANGEDYARQFGWNTGYDALAARIVADYAGDHDPGAGEQYAGEPVPDPWEEVPDGELDPGAVPDQPAQ